MCHGGARHTHTHPTHRKHTHDTHTLHTQHTRPNNAWQPEGVTVTHRGSPICGVHGKLYVENTNLRANHTMRTSVYCRSHDALMWHSARELLGDISSDREAEARQLRCQNGPCGQTHLPQSAQEIQKLFQRWSEGSMHTNTVLGVWPNSERYVWYGTRKGFGGDPVGLSSDWWKDHHKYAHEILVSGLTVGSTGHVPSSTLVIGRCPFCQVLAKDISDRTPDAVQG